MSLPMLSLVSSLTFEVAPISVFEAMMELTVLPGSTP